MGLNFKDHSGIWNNKKVKKSGIGALTVGIALLGLSIGQAQASIRAAPEHGWRPEMAHQVSKIGSMGGQTSLAQNSSCLTRLSKMKWRIRPLTWFEKEIR